MEPTSRATVLVVDDNRLNIDLLVEILKNDYKLLVALNGETALEIVQESLPDIILLDIMMPEINGYDVCRRLKSDPRTMKIPVIFITAKSQIEDEALGLALGAVDYITKPVNPAIVQARIKTHLALYNQNRELEEKVRQRTLELERNKEKADEASRAKSAFLANISHELRTPLNHIMGLSTLLLESDDCPERLELIRPINEGAVHLTDLFNQLLDLSMLESDTVTIEFKTFDFMKDLLRQASIFSTYGKKKGVEFKFTADSDLPKRVTGAPVETAQALNNIILNAFRYTEKRLDLPGCPHRPRKLRGYGQEQGHDPVHHPGHWRRHPRRQATNHLRQLRDRGKGHDQTAQRIGYRPDHLEIPGGKAERQDMA